MGRRWIVLAVLVVAATVIFAVVFLVQDSGSPAVPQSAGEFQIPPVGERVTVDGIVGGMGQSEDDTLAFYIERGAEEDSIIIRITEKTIIQAGKFASRPFIEGDIAEGDSVEVEAVSDGERLIAETIKRFRDTDE